MTTAAPRTFLNVNTLATAVPVIAAVALIFVWGRELPGWLVAVVAVLLAGAVLSAVHHAEVVAHRVGEPYGSLVLAVAVTVIEVALIVTMMIGGGEKSQSLARDTVFSAVMLTCNGIVGLSLLINVRRQKVAVFNPDGMVAALATVTTAATLSLVLPTFTTSAPGPQFSPGQLAFAAVASLALYALFVGMQTIRHRDYFLPRPIMLPDGTVRQDSDESSHADPPSTKTALISLLLLFLALVAVVGHAKTVSPSIEAGVKSAGLPQSVVGVIIALLVLLPETVAAARAARRNRLQTSMNLALGSAMASIGLTVPVIAVAMIWLDGPLVLGLGPTHMVLLILTVFTSGLTLLRGRATLLQAGVQLSVLAAFLFLAVSP